MRTPSKIAAGALYLLSSGVALALAPGPITRLSNSGSLGLDQLGAVISATGPSVIWTLDSGAPNGLDVMYLPHGGTAINITPFPKDQVYPMISGHWAAWVDDSALFENCMLYDLSQNFAPISYGIDASAHCESPDLDASGSTVHYVEVHRSTFADIIYLPDPLTVVWVTHGETFNEDPRISGDFIVWHSQTAFGQPHHIFSYQISSGTTRQLTGGSSDDTYPDVDAGNVVFIRGGRVYTVPATGGTLRPLSLPQSAAPHVVRIAGNVVVWDDFRNGADYDIYGNNVTASYTAEVPLVTGANDQILPDVAWIRNSATMVYTECVASNVCDVYEMALH